MVWYRLLRGYIQAGLHIYFNKIEVKGQENIPSHGVIFAANHQNAFMDALLIICNNTHITNSLTRADIFKNSVSRWMLTYLLHLIPVYRIRDGWQTLGQNKDSFEEAARRLGRNEAIIIFPEGNHGSHRRLRPLSRGFTRLAFEARQSHPNNPLSIVPVGINYTDAHYFGGSVRVVFGEPLNVADYHREPLTQSANDLREALAERLRRLIIHVPESFDHDAAIDALHAEGCTFLDPAKANQRLEEWRQLGAVPTVSEKRKEYSHYRLVPALLHFLPWIGWNALHQRIKDPVFTSSLRFATGLFGVPIYYAVVGGLLYLLFPPIWVLGWLAISLASLPFLCIRKPLE